MKDIDDVVATMQKDFPEISRKEIVDAMHEATTQPPRVQDDLSKKLAALKAEAKGDVKLHAAIDAMQKNVDEGTLPDAQGRPRKLPPKAIADLRQQRIELAKQMEASDPALRKKYLSKIAELTTKLMNPPEPPATKADAPMSKEIERLAYQRDRLQSQVRQRIEALKPKSVWSNIPEVFNAARAVMTSFDLSAVFRQGGFIAIGNPARAAKAIVPMLRAFASEQTAHTINAEILDRPNAPLYARSKLYLSPLDSVGLNAKEEMFMSHWVKKIPGIASSERAYNTFLNKLRADSFDTMAATLAKNGEPTMDESKAIANFINVATGRGKVPNAIEQASVALNTAFFAPKYVISRFQLLGGQPLYGGTARTRGLVAKEYAKFLIGMGTVYAIGAAAGGTIETDPRSTDFLKLKFGNTRLDPLMGMQQIIVPSARLASGEEKSPTGHVVPLGGGKNSHRSDTYLGVVGRFFRSKLSPMAGTALDAITREDLIGQPVTPGSIASNLTVPMSFKDVYNAMEDQGVQKGAALGLLNILGAGLQTYPGPTPLQQLRADKAAAKEAHQPFGGDSILRNLEHIETLKKGPKPPR